MEAQVRRVYDELESGTGSGTRILRRDGGVRMGMERGLDEG